VKDDTDYCLKLLKQIKALKEEVAILKKIVLEQNDTMSFMKDEKAKMLRHVDLLYQLIEKK